MDFRCQWVGTDCIILTGTGEVLDSVPKSILGFPGGSVVKNLPARAGDAGDVGSIARSGKIPWRSKWQSTPVFLPGESHGQRSLVGYSPWCCKESLTT